MISIPPNKVLHTKVQYLPSVREAKSHNFHFYNSTVSLGAVPEVRIMLLECYSSTKYLNLVDPLEYCPVAYNIISYGWPIVSKNALGRKFPGPVFST